MPESYKQSTQDRLAVINPAKKSEKPLPFPTYSPVRAAKKPRFTSHHFGFADYVWISLLWYGITFLWGGMNGVILPHLNQLYVDANFKGTALGIITAVGMLVAIIVQPAAGALSDISRHGWGRRRPFILVGGLSLIGCLIFMAAMVVFFGNWWMLLVCYILIQFSDNIAQGAYQGIIPDVVPEHKRGRASGAMGIAQTLGNVTGLAAATAFIDAGYVQYGLIAIAGVFALSLIFTLIRICEEPLPPRDAEVQHVKVVLGTLSEVLQHRNFRLFILSRLFVMTGLAVITIFALYYLQDVFGQREGSLTQSYTILGLAVIVTSILAVFPAVWLSERFGRKRIVIISCLVGAAGMVLMISAISMTQVIIYGCIIGYALGSFNSIDWALATDIIPREAAGRFMGVSNLAGAGSQALAAFLGGALLDGFNALGVHLFNVKNVGYSALFTMAIVFFLLGAFFLKKIVDPKRMTNDERLSTNRHS